MRSSYCIWAVVTRCCIVIDLAISLHGLWVLCIIVCLLNTVRVRRLIFFRDKIMTTITGELMCVAKTFVICRLHVQVSLSPSANEAHSWIASTLAASPAFGNELVTLQLRLLCWSAAVVSCSGWASFIVCTNQFAYNDYISRLYLTQHQRWPTNNATGEYCNCVENCDKRKLLVIKTQRTADVGIDNTELSDFILCQLFKHVLSSATLIVIYVQPVAHVR